MNTLLITALLNCTHAQSALEQAKRAYDRAEQALGYSFISCVNAPDQRVCLRAFRDFHEKKLAELQGAGRARNESCAN